MADTTTEKREERFQAAQDARVKAEADAKKAQEQAEKEQWKQVEQQEASVEKQIQADREKAEAQNLTVGEAKVLPRVEPPAGGPGPIVPPPVPDPNREPLPWDEKVENPKSGGSES